MSVSDNIPIIKEGMKINKPIFLKEWGKSFNIFFTKCKVYFTFFEK